MPCASDAEGRLSVAPARRRLILPPKRRVGIGALDGDHQLLDRYARQAVATSNAGQRIADFTV